MAVAAGLVVAGSELFSYNRENWFFNKEQWQKRAFQGQEMGIKQYELYREDIQDLVGLTVRKMDNYLLVNTLQLGFCITLLTDGRPVRHGGKDDAPTWLIGLYAMCCAGAFLYYLLSMWLAMHASIAAHSFGTRLLTQEVRLPVPSSEQLEAATAQAENFEGLGASDLFRVPMWEAQMKALSSRLGAPTRDRDGRVADDDPDSATEADHNSGSLTSLPHVHQFRQLQTQWQSYDAYARVCMALGTNQVLHTLTYEVLILLMVENAVPFPAFCCVVIFTVCGFTIARLDLYLSPTILRVSACLLVLPPVFAIICLILWRDMKYISPELRIFIYNVLVPLVYLLHVVWIIFSTQVAKAGRFGEVKLPINFRSVLFLDVFNWLTSNQPTDPQVPGSQPDLSRTSMSDLTRCFQPQGTASRQSAGPALPHISENLAGREIAGGTTSAGPPAIMRKVLEKEFIKLKRRIQADLQRWAKMQELEGDYSGAKEQLESFRQQVESLNVEGISSEATAEVSPRDHEEHVWLPRQYWNSQGMLSYWYRCETAQTTFEMPEPEQDHSVRICDLHSVERSIQLLVEKQQDLTGIGQHSTSWPTPPPSPVMTRQTIPTRLIPAEGSGAPGTVSATLSTHGSPLIGRPAHRRNPRSERCIDRWRTCGCRRTARGAGELPWDTVRKGSQALIVAWFTGFAWVILYIWFGADVPFPEDRPHHDDNSTIRLPHFESVAVSMGSGGARLQPIGGAWPMSLMKPQAIACHSALGPFALASSKYAVHVLPLAGQNRSQSSDTFQERLQERLDACLQRAPGFQSRGLASVSIGCTAIRGAEQCAAIILGTSGSHALRCRLCTGSAGAAGEPCSSSAELLELHGGPWSSLAAGSEDGESLWVARPDRDSVVQLRPRGAKANEFWPHLDLAFPAGEESQASNVSDLHAMASGVLSLYRDGRVRWWSLQGGKPQQWERHGQEGSQRRWSGICAAEGFLYLLGEGEGGGRGSATSVGLWRAELPVAA